MNADYCGIKPPTPAPAPRDPGAIAMELRRAAGRLEYVAGYIGGGFTAGAIAEANGIVTGIERLLTELRQREGA